MKPSIPNAFNAFARFNWREHVFGLYRRDKVLALTVAFNLVLLVCMLVVMPFDSRLVMGMNPWIKPMKFAISFALYVYTIARLLEYLRLPNWGKRLIGWGVSVCVLAQMVCITIQAARGTTSHFNFTTRTDATISIIMDLMDPINGLFVVALLIFACLARYEVTRPSLWSIRLGLAIFLGASLIGVVMVVNGAHSIGVADGGPGLPLMDWSTTGGDLRIAHFVGLHALQVLPVGAWLIAKKESWNVSWQTASVLVLAAAYALVVLILYLQAVQGGSVLKV